MFLKKHACYGFPSDKAPGFGIGPWIWKQGAPAKQSDGITIIPCFSDDKSPDPSKATEKDILPGRIFYTDQAIILYDIDRWTNIEMAITLLHEARHTRHRLGGKLASLPPLDKEEFHEGNTWLFMLALLNAWGKENWRDAVKQEVAWLGKQLLHGSDSSKIMYHQSSNDWPGLSLVFGEAKHNNAGTLRRKLVSLQANMDYWSDRFGSLSPEQVCHTIMVGHFYK
ncbi:MAG TPA: hypothetical protein VLG69_03720 [Candidatus Andersenbacteria bacterium]|nr:hypothetical protein [Candidatus Andersenbacteria bacterium]